MSNIHVYDADYNSLVEWDSIFFKLDDTDITLHVIEAKQRTSKRSQKCKIALLDSFRNAAIAFTNKQPRIYRQNGYAHTKISIHDIEITT